MAKESNPFGDMTKMMAQYQMPGIDMSAFIDARRKDIEALAAANAAAYESMQALARRQGEMLAETMQGIQEAAKSAASGTAGFPDPAKQAELARTACEKALADLTELAEMARKSQTDMMATMTQRAAHNMEEMKKMMQPK